MPHVKQYCIFRCDQNMRDGFVQPGALMDRSPPDGQMFTLEWLQLTGWTVVEKLIHISPAYPGRQYEQEQYIFLLERERFVPPP